MIRNTAIKVLKSTFAIIALMILSLSAFANNGFDHVFSKQQATQDLSFYFKLIDEQHGNPYAYISRAEFKQLVDANINSLPESITYQHFSSLVVELNQKLRCGHTAVSIDTQILKTATEKSDFFPYPVSIIDNEIYIDFEGGTLPLGSKIVSINGITSQQLVKELTALTVTDGYIETKKYREVEQKFGYYFFLKYGASPEFNVDSNLNGKTSTTAVQGIPGNQMMANNYMRPVYQTNERYIHFTHVDAIDSLQTLVLTLNTFQASPEWFFQKIYDQYSAASKGAGVKNLVLDLRNNEGGDRRLLNFLYKMIAGTDLVDPSSTSTRSLKITHEDQLMGINGAVGSEEVVANAEQYLEKYFTSNAKGEFVNDTQNWHEEFELGFDLKDLKFEGQVYVLTSGKTFSAAADFARILGQLDNVILVGEETGGANAGRTANMLLNYSLPNSALMVQVPVISETFQNKGDKNEKGRGVFPDFTVKKTYADLINKQDAVFNFTLDLIAHKPNLVASTSLGQ
ncbi:S41 family peptidase [uncultured Roseivirga sp.]|uniref:S41 family peptidase n=1 Tax=uncultured Roseivirga sp. TaxID=543088 RepID=UPI0030DD323B|tara:strand:- start:488792 stop:490330 length:1539 start_codon:yes stop_codon:yes gene_type:complete